MAAAIHDAASADPRCRSRPSLPMTTLKLQDGNEFTGLRSTHASGQSNTDHAFMNVMSRSEITGIYRMQPGCSCRLRHVMVLRRVIRGGRQGD